MLRLVSYFFLIFFINAFDSDSQQLTNANLPPVISSEGDAIYCPQTEQNIVTSFDIDDPDDTTLDALYVQISQGYVPGEDTLILSSEIQGGSGTLN